MKFKYFYFLLIFTLLFIFSLAINAAFGPKFIVVNSISLAGFWITYFFMVIAIVNNKDVVLRAKNPLPIIMPVIIYSSIAIPEFFITRLDNLIIFFFPIILYLISLLFYFLACSFLIKDLRNDFIAYKKSIKIPEYNGPKKKLVLINPVNKNNRNHNVMAVIPPMGLGIIASLTPPEFDIKLIDENFTEFQFEDADIVGITSFTSDINRAYEIASVYKKKKIPVVIGGIHATVRPKEASLYADVVVTGEAEYVWPKVLSDFKKKKLKKIYNGQPLEMKDYVPPRRDLFDDRYIFGTIQTSRGCPFKCSFCAVSTINGTRYRQRDVKSILDELEGIPQKHIYFIDDNILGYGKESEKRSVELFKGMVERKMKKEWFCQSSINFGSNDDVLYWAAKSGCKIVFLGLESPNPEELKGMNKFINTKIEYTKAFKNINRHGIAVLGSFIYGSDEETIESMNFKTNYIIKNDIDVIEAKVYTPLPGTQLFNEFSKNKRLLYTNFPADWDKYNLIEVTFDMKKIPNDVFKENMYLSVRKLLSKPNLIKKFFNTLKNTKKLSTAFWAFNSNLNYVLTNQNLKKK